MSDWVRDSAALEVVLKLRAVQIGDELEEQATGGGAVYPIRICDEVGTPSCTLSHFFDLYQNGLVREDGNFTIIGWRRPAKLKGETE